MYEGTTGIELDIENAERLVVDRLFERRVLAVRSKDSGPGGAGRPRLCLEGQVLRYVEDATALYSSTQALSVT